MNNNNFLISFEWLSREHGDIWERATFAELKIVIDGQVVTEVDDLMAKTVRDHVRVSVYHFALWLVANWWRLRWETQAPSSAWKMSHKVGGAGGGYAWPDLTFCSDGDTILASVRPTSGWAGDPVRYLRTLDLFVGAEEFEREVDAFVAAVLERLSVQSFRENPLSALWGELDSERRDPTLIVRRKREAILGYDPDEAPDGLIESLRSFDAIAGLAAVEEVASAGRSKVLEYLEMLTVEAKAKSLPAEIPDGEALRQHIRMIDTQQLPWQRAEQAARMARKQWRLEPGPLPNTRFSELLAVPVKELAEQTTGILPLPIAAGYRINDNTSRINVFLNKRLPTGRRFALARLLADHLYADFTDRLLPATEAATSRQKFQRAFAQELLCPFDELIGFIDNDQPNEDLIENAAAHFEVSPLLVKTTLVNKGLVARDVLGA